VFRAELREGALLGDVLVGCLDGPSELLFPFRGLEPTADSEFAHVRKWGRDGEVPSDSGTLETPPVTPPTRRLLAVSLSQGVAVYVVSNRTLVVETVRSWRGQTAEPDLSTPSSTDRTRPAAEDDTAETDERAE
jgi:hypothetical protein